MGRYSIPAKAWQRATNVLLWYPDNVKECREAVSNETGDPSRMDPTAKAAIRLATSKRYNLIKQEIEAVEYAVSFLRQEELQVIRRRFWTNCRGMVRHPVKYEYLSDLPYSNRQMHRITKSTIIRIAKYIGEI